MDQSAVLDIKAIIHSVKGEYIDEIECTKSAINIYIDGFGEYHRRIFELAIRLAKAHQNNEQPQEAIKVLNHYLNISQKMLGNDALMTVSIQNQLNQLYQQYLP